MTKKYDMTEGFIWIKLCRQYITINFLDRLK
ncbi:hypothetical protein C825_004165 [Parabacteroides sp. ASF519]|uniref:Uncharacterized protein n=1 Tax=Parabacteroides goldsteinii dnLKV18 TaxID=1235789 RepID=S0GJ73_9BACT|nr:hypothetical protein C803_01913 [Parabacteroides goldsteinii dnLKV18]KAI4362087.1 hypothetical protein C825_004165 [Parabacteroides sp. ASF519]